MPRKAYSVAIAANLVFACSGSATDPVSLSEPTRTHAIISVEQQRLAPATALSDASTDGEVETDTAIMFGLLRLPLTVNSSRMLQLMGLGQNLPTAGSCEVLDSTTVTAPALSGYERVELLDVGDITVTGKGKSQRLSRQAFPTVTDFIAGVLYTTRENPSGFTATPDLTVRARGSATIPAFTVSTKSVELPLRITIDGTPVNELSRLSSLSSFEVRWTQGRSGDLIWLELGPVIGKKNLSCAFNDSSGFGIVPGMQLNTTGDGRLVFHRLSVQEVTIGSVDRAEIRFDVRLAQPVSLY
jgi:hypothetical protein